MIVRVLCQNRAWGVQSFSSLTKIGNVLVLHKKDDPQCADYSKEIIQILKDYNTNVFVEENNFQDVKQFKPSLFEKDQQEIMDLIVTVGGDGTVLHGMKLFQDKFIPPFLTFGKGTLGFMCVYGVQNYKKHLTEVLQGKYTIEKKNRLFGAIYGSALEDASATGIHQEPIFKYNALNEFCISKNNYVLTLDIFINDIFVTQTRGDGLIVSTPTGSTAYSLSVGGPIVHNEVPCILISPICPLSLSFRPIVIPETMKLRIKMSSISKSEGSVIADGQQFTPFKQAETLIIQKSEKVIKFIHPADEPHFDNWAMKLKRFLNWNSKFENNHE